MQGLRIINKCRFHDNFAPLFEELKGLHWLLEDDSLFFPPHLEDISTYDANGIYMSGPGIDFQKNRVHLIVDDNSWSVFKNDIFPLYSFGVKEDWNLIWGFKPNIDLSKWAIDYWSVENRTEYICEILKSVFLI